MKLDNNHDLGAALTSLDSEESGKGRYMVETWSDDSIF